LLLRQRGEANYDSINIEIEVEDLSQKPFSYDMLVARLQSVVISLRITD
jgi:DNA-binding response OmpR family regulator